MHRISQLAKYHDFSNDIVANLNEGFMESELDCMKIISHVPQVQIALFFDGGHTKFVM